MISMPVMYAQILQTPDMQYPSNTASTTKSTIAAPTLYCETTTTTLFILKEEVNNGYPN